MNYKLNDSELLYLIRENNEGASNLLINKYENSIKILASSYLKENKKYGIEYNDLMQEGYLGLLEAIDKFNEDKNFKFITYSNKCIKNKYNRLINIKNNTKNKVMNNYEELDLNLILSDNNKMIDIEIMNRMLLNDIISNKNKLLTEKESKIIKYKIKGYKNQEIALFLNKSKQNIESSIFIIRKKLKTLENNYKV